MIAHVDMDAFYASVEVLDRPELRGKPVIVGGRKRGVVSAASYQARKAGVRSAMPIFRAKRLCPQGVFLPVRMSRYIQVSRVVMRTLEGFTPRVEQVSVDEAFLDLSGTQRLWGTPAQTGQAIKKAVRDSTGLTCSVGVAPLRFLAKIASDRDKPDGLTVVEDVETFLSTVQLKEISGVGAVALGRLSQAGLSHLVQVRQVGSRRLAKMLGSFGERLWDLAHGVDPTGVNAGGAVKSVSHELTLEQDTGDIEILAAHLLGLTQKVCRRLRKKGLCGRVVTLKLKYFDHRLITRRRTLPEPSDTAGDIYKAARSLLESAAAGPFRLIGVGVSGLMERRMAPASLFESHVDDKEKGLAQAEDELYRRFGEKALVRASTLTTLDRRRQGRHNDEGK